MKKPSPKKRNLMARDLRTPKYRVRVIPNKKRVIPRRKKHSND